MKQRVFSVQPGLGLKELQALEACMTVASDDDVVMQDDAQRTGDLGDLLGHLDVGARRRRIAGRVIVEHTTNFGIYLEIKRKYENFR